MIFRIAAGIGLFAAASLALALPGKAERPDQTAPQWSGMAMSYGSRLDEVAACQQATNTANFNANSNRMRAQTEFPDRPIMVRVERCQCRDRSPEPGSMRYQCSVRWALDAGRDRPGWGGGPGRPPGPAPTATPPVGGPAAVWNGMEQSWGRRLDEGAACSAATSSAHSRANFNRDIAQREFPGRPVMTRVERCQCRDRSAEPGSMRWQCSVRWSLNAR